MQAGKLSLVGRAVLANSCEVFSAFFSIMSCLHCFPPAAVFLSCFTLLTAETATPPEFPVGMDMSARLTETAADRGKISLENGTATLTSPMQKLKAMATAGGLMLESLEDNGGTLSLKAHAIGRGQAPLSLLPASGTVGLVADTVTYTRSGLTEEYSSTADGIRQDFIVHASPPGGGPLVLELSLADAVATDSSSGCIITITSGGRELAYGKLLVTDATGRQLPATLRTSSTDRLVVRLDDTAAVYPVRVDPTFSDADWISLSSGVAGTNGTVAKMVYENGSLYAGGNFTVAGDVAASNIARWDGSKWHALGSGVEGSVTSMIFSSGQLYVAGSFTTAGGTPANNIARWDGAAWHALGDGVNDTVDALEIYGGHLHAAGLFTTAGGVSSPYLAKWNGTAWEAFGPAPDNRVLDLQRVGSYLYACGFLSSAGGVSTPGVARWDGTAWSGLGTIQSFSNTYYRLHSDGVHLYVSGTFTMQLGDHLAAYNLAKWDGAAWSTMGMAYSSGVFEMVMHDGELLALKAGSSGLGAIIKWDGAKWVDVTGIGDGMTLVSGGGRLFVGGHFHEAGGKKADFIASYDGTEWAAMGYGTDGEIHSLLSRDGELFVSGDFTSIGGIDITGLARWDGGSWSAVGTGPQGPAGDMVFFGNDLIVCGTFGKMGTADDHRIARWDGKKWWPFDAGLVGSWPVALATRGNTLCAGGNFFAADYAYGVAKWNGSSWVEVGTGLPPIDTLEVDSHAIYVAASGLRIDNQWVGGIARWDGTSWTGMGGGTDFLVSDIVSDDSAVYIGGQFTTAGGLPANCVARWDGVKWNALTTEVEAPYNTPYVASLMIHGGSLYAGGHFSNIDGVPGTRNIARWDALNGSGWHALGTGTDRRVLDMVATDSGELVISGDFTMVGKTVSPGIAQATNLLEIPPFSVAAGATPLMDGGAPVDFGPKTVGHPATRSLTITLLVEDFGAFSPGKIEGPHAGDFSVSNFSGVGSGAGDAGSFTVTFNPTGPGPRHATLRLSEAAPNSIPFDIALTGTGVPVVPKLPEIDIQQPAGTSLVEGKAKITFAKTTVLKKGESKTFVIRNTGKAALSGVSVSMSGTHKKDFLASSPAKTTLAPGASTSFKVRFVPTGSGKRSAVIRIESNDANENPFDINLIGNGVKAKK